MNSQRLPCSPKIKLNASVKSFWHINLISFLCETKIYCKNFALDLVDYQFSLMDFLTLEMEFSLIEIFLKIFGLIRFKCMFK